MFLFVIIMCIFLLGLVVYRYKKQNYLIFELMSVYWIFFIVGSRILYMNHNWHMESALYLLVTCIVFGVGEEFGKKMIFSKKRIQYRVPTLNKSAAWMLLVIILLLAMVYPIYRLLINGFSLSSFFNTRNFYAMNNYFEYQRYEMDVGVSVFEQVLLTFSYLSPLVGGYMFVWGKNKYNSILCLCTIIPQLISTLSTNAKTGVMCALLLWITGYLDAKLSKDGYFQKLSKKMWLILVLVSGMFLVIMMITFFARKGEISVSSIEYMKEDMGIYAFGHMQALDVWFSNGEPFNNELTCGYFTFAGIARIFFDASFVSGVYEFVPGADSNIFTAYRGLITDFGICGSLIISLIMGWLSGISAHSISLYNSRVGRTVFASILFFVLYSFIISAWSFNSLTLTFILFYLFLFYVEHTRRDVMI